MDSLLQEVAKHCAKQLKEYGDCVDKEGDKFGERCMDLKRLVTECAAANVAAVNRVKERCSDQIMRYESCLEKNSANPSVCSEQVRALYDCTREPNEQQRQ